MGPTKAIVTENALYEAVSGKLIQAGFANRRDIQDYVNHHYLALPVVDNQGRPWVLEEKPGRSSPWRAIRDPGRSEGPPRSVPGLRRHGIRSDELSVETDVIRCTSRAGMNSMPGWK